MHQLTVQQLTRLAQFNEYEGQLLATVAGHDLLLHVLIYNAEDWQRFAQRSTILADIWMERSGSFEQLSTALPHQLQQLAATQYAVVGTIQAIDGEHVLLDTIMSLRIDLDLTPSLITAAASIQPGDCIRVVGTLKADLYGEER